MHSFHIHFPIHDGEQHLRKKLWKKQEEVGSLGDDTNCVLLLPPCDGADTAQNNTAS